MKILLTLSIALLTAMTFYVADAEAKRFGGGMSLGKQYSTSSRKPAAPSAGATGRAPGSAPWRDWPPAVCSPPCSSATPSKGCRSWTSSCSPP